MWPALLCTGLIILVHPTLANTEETTVTNTFDGLSEEDLNELAYELKDAGKEAFDELEVDLKDVAKEILDEIMNEIDEAGKEDHIKSEDIDPGKMEASDHPAIKANSEKIKVTLNNDVDTNTSSVPNKKI